MRNTLCRRAALAFVFAALVAAIVPVAAMAAPLVVIDPGHGGPYSNANANGLREKNVNLAIALELRRQLTARGFRVTMTRTSDRAVSLADLATWNLSRSVWYFGRDGHRRIYNGIPKDDLQARADVANRAGADLFISIHNNGAASRYARGTETFAAARDRTAIPLSKLVHRRIIARTGLRDRGARTADFYVLRWSNMPAILVEGAFITNPSDAWKLKQYTYRKRIAVGIAEAVASWFKTNPYTVVAPEVTATSVDDAAVKLSKTTHPVGAPAVLIAREDRWADAAAAPALAEHLGAPLLWVGASAVPTATQDELSRLSAARLVLVGIDGSFDDTMTSALATASGVATSSIEFVSAPNRPELAASIAATMTPPGTSHIIIADAADTNAALVAGALAASLRAPLLLSVHGVLPSDATDLVARQMETTTTAILFGTATSTPATMVPGAAKVVRFSNADIGALASAVNRWRFPATTRGSLRPVVADYSYQPGYLTAGLYAAHNGIPLVPVLPRILPDMSRHWITAKRPQIAGFTVFDARGTIPPLMGHMLRKADAE